jgi:hypothetical protein
MASGKCEAHYEQYTTRNIAANIRDTCTASRHIDAFQLVGCLVESRETQLDKLMQQCDNPGVVVT